MFAAALICGAMTMTSCQGLFDAIFGVEDEPASTNDLNLSEKIIGKWWEIESINNGLMKWTALRQKEDDSAYTVTFEMTLVE